MKLITLSNIEYQYPETNNLAVNDVSFTINEGDYISILGANGSGKSTISKILFGFIKPTKGNIEYFSEDAIIGFVQQEPRYQVIAGTVEKDTSFGPENLSLSLNEIKNRTVESLGQTNLLTKLKAKTHTLSLGQTQKLALSGILALHPKLLILDEAVSMIDPESRKNILKTIETLHKNGTTIIHVTHDFDEAFMAERIIAVENGKILFDDTKEKFRDNIHLLFNIFGSMDSPVFKRNLIQQNNPVNFDNYPISLVLQNISFEYFKGIEVLSDISLAFKAGTITAIMGESGSGKSTLFEIISTLLAPTKGRLFASGQCSLALQDSDSALFKTVAADDVAFGPANNGKKGKELKHIVQTAMNQCSLPFDKFKDRLVYSLSGGEKRKLALAGIIALDTPIILFDEPGAALDPSSREKLFKLLQELANQGKTIIFSTHRIEESFAADRVIKIDKGKIIQDTVPVTIPEELPHIPENLNYKKHFKLLNNLRNISLGDYVDKKSIIHHLKPITKFILFLLVFINSLIFQKPLTMGIACGVSLIYALFTTIPISKLLLRTIKIIPWIVFFFVLQVLLFPVLETDTIVFSWHFIHLTDANIVAGIKMLLHFIAAMICISGFIYSIEETELIEALKAFLLPLQKLHVPTKCFIVFVLMIMRYVPLLTEETAHIIKTQIIRNGIKTSSGFINKIKAILPIIVPVVIQTIKRSNNFAQTLQARYF